MTVGERELPSRKSWPISHRLLGRETRKDGCGKGVLSEQFMSNQPAHGALEGLAMPLLR